MFVRFRMSWNFDLPVYALYGHTPLRTIMLLTFVNYPMDLVVQHILQRLLQSRDPLVRVVAYNVIPM